MQYFIGIVPPDEYKKRIIEFQQQWENNGITEVAEPHITIKAQGGLTPDEKWMDAVITVCEAFPSFHVALGKPAFFGDSVLFLSVDSEKIVELHKKLVAAVSPDHDLIKRYMELDYYEPHLTLGQTYWGISSKELKDMANKAEGELSPYPAFDVNFIRVYQEVEPNKYIKYADISLRMS